MNTENIPDLALLAASAFSLVFCALIFRTWIRIWRGGDMDLGEPDRSSRWPKSVMWIAVAGAIFAYHSGETVLVAVLAFLAGTALTFDVLFVREELRRSSGQPLRRVK